MGDLNPHVNIDSRFHKDGSEPFEIPANLFERVGRGISANYSYFLIRGYSKVPISTVAANTIKPLTQSEQKKQISNMHTDFRNWILIEFSACAAAPIPHTVPKNFISSI